MPYTPIIEFWFEQTSPAQWWRKDKHFDALVEKNFSSIHHSATHCELFAWRRHPLGRLAEIIVIDQFSRNIYRDQARAFTHDNLALALAQQAIDAGVEQRLSDQQRGFLYMPYMHSESRAIQKLSVDLFSQPGLEKHLSSALQHRAIIEQFGRYPHRNKTLQRPSTAEEIAFLEQPGSSF